MLPRIKHTFSLVAMLALFNFAATAGLGQQQLPSSSPIVTAASAGNVVRVSAAGNITHIRLEVFSAAGERVFDSGQHDGNLLDWRWQDEKAPAFNADSYLCVVTVQSLSGKTSRKLANLSFANQQATLKPVEVTQLNSVQAQALSATETDMPLTIIGAEQPIAATVIAHDGNDGQVTRTRGAFTFRFGDFFSGKDTEQMRLTEEGNLGIGTSEPQAKLDVAGTIRAERVLIAKPKTPSSNSAPATDTTDSPQPLASGTGTQNRIAKWIDNVGTLGDSAVTEVSGNVGIGTANPANKLDVVRGAGGVMAKSFYEMSSFEYNADAKFGVYSSSGTAPSAALTFGSTNLQVNSKFPGFELQYIYGNTAPSNQMRFNYIERDTSGPVVNFAANLLTVNGNGDVTLNPVTSGVTASPRLGIGTASPTERLHVVGNGLFTGNLTVNGTLNATLPATSVSGVLPIANGGTGSATQNFVDLSTNQPDIGGNKTFTGAVGVTGAGVFNGNGSGLTNLNGANITNNTINASALASDTFPNSRNLSLLGSRRWDLLSQRVEVGNTPHGVAFDGANIWVTNLFTHNVTKVRVSDGAVQGTFSVGTTPIGIAFDGANIWVANQNSNNVTKLRASDGAVQGTFAVVTSPRAVAFDGSNIWVANANSDNVTKLRASDGACVGTCTFAVGTEPFGVEFDGANVWVVNRGSNNVTKLRASDGAVQGTFAVGITPQGVAFDGANIWVTNSFNGNVTKLRASDGALQGTFAVGNGPNGVAFDGVNIWVANFGAGSSTVTKLRASDGANLGTFAAGSQPAAVAFDGANIWVTNYNDNTVIKLPVFP